MAAQWHGAEAWIFLSIGDAAGSGLAKLDEVLWMADSNNHAIPTVREFCLAVGQLIGAGLIEISEEGYGLSAKGQILYTDLNAPRRGHIERFLAIADEWRSDAPSTAEPIHWEIADDEFRHAYEAYNRRFWATYRMLKKGE